MKQIQIGDARIPLDSYTIGGTAILGIREAGKTFTAKSIAEQLLDCGVPIIAFDAIGVWRYLKVAGPNGRGFPVVVAGGKEPDLPLNPANAATIVRAAIRENIPLVIDLYDKSLSKADWRRIVQSCFRTLLYENTGLRHIFLEETPEYAPQKITDGETYAEVEKLVRMGGNASLGITLISQRAQEVNKAVLDLCENMVLMRQRGAHAIDSLEKWMDRLAPQQAKKIAADLPNLKAGGCYVFTGDGEEPIRTRSNPILSFHPDRRKPAIAGSKMAVVETSEFVQRLTGDLAKVIEEAKANDPAALKAQIADLKKQLAAKSAPADSFTVAEMMDARRAGEQEGFDRAIKVHTDYAYQVEEWLARFPKADSNNVKLPVRPTGPLYTIHAERPLNPATSRALGEVARAAARSMSEPTAGGGHARGMRSPKDHSRAAAAPAVKAGAAGSSTDLPKGEAATLAALIQYPAGLRREQLTVLTGYKRSSRDAHIQRLRERGYCDTSGERVTATDEGVAAMPNAEPLPTGEALQEFWLARLPEGERKILQVLLEAGGRAVDRNLLDARTGYKRSSRDAYLQRLSAKELVTEPQRGSVAAAAQLFE